MVIFNPDSLTGNRERDAHTLTQESIMHYLKGIGHNITLYPRNRPPAGAHFKVDGHSIAYHYNQSQQRWITGNYNTISAKIVLEHFDDYLKKTPGWLYYSPSEFLMVYLSRLGLLLQFRMDALRKGLDKAIASGAAGRESEKDGRRMFVDNVSVKTRYYHDGTAYNSQAWMVELYEIVRWPGVDCVVYDLDRKLPDGKPIITALDSVQLPAGMQPVDYTMPEVTPFDPFAPRTKVQDTVNEPVSGGNAAPSPNGGKEAPKESLQYPVGTLTLGQTIFFNIKAAGREIPLKENKRPIEKSYSKYSLNIDKAFKEVQAGNIRARDTLIKAMTNKSEYYLLVETGRIKVVEADKLPFKHDTNRKNWAFVYVPTQEPPTQGKMF